MKLSIKLKKKILVVNLIKLFISKSGKNFLEEIKNLIEIIKQYNDNNILDIFLEGNILNIALFKYERQFIEFFKNNKKTLNDNFKISKRKLKYYFKTY